MLLRSKCPDVLHPWVSCRALGMMVLISSAALVAGVRSDLACPLKGQVVSETTVDGVDLLGPNIASARRAVVIPLREVGAKVLTSGVITIKVSLRPLRVDPEEQLLLQVQLTDKTLDNAPIATDAVLPDAAGSAFFKPLSVGEKKEVFLSLPAWESPNPPKAAIVGIVLSTDKSAPINSAIEILAVDILS
ncbi:hypothetical protein X741_18210 [Mesorhizobium sp. LNHC229A00]|nr:hypothetical protein X741_18210 [Mesorhizobium sp. LNHC229A00]